MPFMVKEVADVTLRGGPSYTPGRIDHCERKPFPEKLQTRQRRQVGWLYHTQGTPGALGTRYRLELR